MKPTPLGDEPCMSDQTLLVSVEDLIHLAMGPQDGNVVDFKAIQMILHILARQMRLLEQKVVLEVGELPTRKGDTSASQSTSDDSKRQSRGKKRDIEVIKEETEGKSRRPSAGRGKSTDRGKDQDMGKGQDGGKAQAGGKGTDGGKGQGEGKDQGGKGQEGGGKGQEEGKSSGGKGQEGGKAQDGGKSQGGKSEEGGKSKGKEQVKADRQGEEGMQGAAKEGKKGKKGQEKEDDTGKPGKTGMTIKEGKGPGNEKVLVVEKGPTTRGSADGSRRSIEVVTRSQFALLEAAVAALREHAGPLPPLALPDNAQLRSDLARGTASLTDTMQAMQVSARVQAAEQALARLGGLLTQLAAAGAIPEDAVARAAAVTFDRDQEEGAEGMERSRLSTASKSVGIHPATKEKAGTDMSRRQSRVSSRPSTASRASAPAISVTHPELADALMNLRQDLMKEAQKLISKAATASEGAVNTAKAVAEKLDVAVKLNERITKLYSLVGDYSEQLSGFDAGLTTQMLSFQEQMVQMRSDLRGGLTQLENANANAETAAVMELTERYELLVAELEHTVQGHQALTSFQQLLAADLRSLAACVEMLREQKADRDEVLDGLRDKADNTRLAGLLRLEEFEEARKELERRMDVCHDKFHRQELVWMTAMKDLTEVVRAKAELMELLKMREESTAQLQDLHNKVKKLELVLGEPKAAVLTRQLSRGGLCAACLAPALMRPADAASGQPPALPRARPEPAAAAQPCETTWKPDEPPDPRTHTCRRWVGGSHTLLTFAARAQAGAGAAPPEAPPTKKYTGVGNDGRLYLMETEMQPCVECNPLEPEPAPGTPATPEEGAGDGKNKDARRRTTALAVEPTALK